MERFKKGFFLNFKMEVRTNPQLVKSLANLSTEPCEALKGLVTLLSSTHIREGLKVTDYDPKTGKPVGEEFSPYKDERAHIDICLAPHGQFGVILGGVKSFSHEYDLITGELKKRQSVDRSSIPVNHDLARYVFDNGPLLVRTPRDSYCVSYRIVPIRCGGFEHILSIDKIKTEL